MVDLGFAIYGVKLLVFKGKTRVMTMLWMSLVVTAVKSVEGFNPFLTIRHTDNIFCAWLAGDHRVRSLHQSAEIESSAQPSTSRTPVATPARNVIQQDQARL